MIAKEKRIELSKWGINDLLIFAQEVGNPCDCYDPEAEEPPSCDCGEGTPIYKEGVFQFFITEMDALKYLETKYELIKSLLKEKETYLNKRPLEPIKKEGIMTKTQFNAELLSIDKQYASRKNSLYVTYAKSNQKYQIGDIVYTHLGNLRIVATDSISHYGVFPEVDYKCEKLTKDLRPYKKSQQAYCTNSSVIKLVTKGENNDEKI